MQTASDIATCMYHTGLDPFTGEAVYTAKNLNDRKLQRALLQFFKPENYFEVRKALLGAGRADLIGSGCDALIPANPPRAALTARIDRANRTLAEGRYVHTIDSPVTPPSGASPGPSQPTRPQTGGGYRPDRKTARRRPRR